MPRCPVTPVIHDLFQPFAMLYSGCLPRRTSNLTSIPARVAVTTRTRPTRETDVCLLRIEEHLVVPSPLTIIRHFQP